MNRLARPYPRDRAGPLESRRAGRFTGRRAMEAAGLLAALAAPLDAQIKSPAERIEELEKRVDDLQDQVRDLEKEQSAARTKEKEKAKDGGGVEEEQDLFAGGILTLGNIRLRIGGKAEFLFIATEEEDDPILGTTDEPDPHFEVDRLRLEPRLDFNREVSLHAQIDFDPDPGRVRLKEMTARHQVDPVWWFGSDFRIGLDDRFFRPQRRTKSYPLIGNAFWRDESAGVLWMLRLGDKDGRPEEPVTVEAVAEPPSREARDEEPGATEPGASEPKAKDGKKKKKKKAKDKAKDDAGAGTEGGPGAEGAPGAGEGSRSGSGAAGDRGNGDDSLTGGGNGAEGPRPESEPAARGPFDFSRNRGEVRLYLAAGNGYTLDANEVGRDGAPFNDLVQDDRNVTNDLSVRDLGVGLGWRRNFEALGEFEILGFYFNDRLNDDSVLFLQNELTLRDVAGNALGGYGDSNERGSERYGVGAEYFLPAERLFGEEMRANDGLRLAGQWIEGQDGEFQRQGWYVQGSYRWSFPQRLLFDRYFRSLEPLVQFGVLRTNLSPFAELPGTWDRKQLVLGLIVEVTGDIFLKVEYAFNEERTGGSRPSGFSAANDVDNDELLIELLLQF